MSEINLLGVGYAESERALSPRHRDPERGGGESRPGVHCGSGTPGIVLHGIMKALQTCLAALREIFDESAYARFLSRRQLDSSPEAYAAFWREHEAGKVRRPKCC